MENDTGMTDILIEYNANGVQVFADDCPGAFARGETVEKAIEKLPRAIGEYRAWTGQGTAAQTSELHPVFQYKSTAAVEEAETNMLFPSERVPMDMAEYTRKKALVLRSAKDVMTLFASIPQKDRALVKSRKCFYGRIPQTSREMLHHIHDVLPYYASCIGITYEPAKDLVEDRMRFFAALESIPKFLDATLFTAPDGELWTRKKVLRRILWHDRIHARAMYRRAITFWQKDRIANPFRFSEKEKK